ncbi:MAG: hypothetical protein ACK5TK_15850 [Betaproteobacteria bacterium]
MFFGRQADEHKLREQLVERERQGYPGALIVANSGVGKSSFAQAGLIRELQAQLKDRPLEWRIWRPGSASGHDEAGLVAGVRGNWTQPNAIGALNPQAPCATFAQLLAALDPAHLAAARFLWVIDQFEELFTAGAEPAAVTALCEFIRQLQQRGVWVVGTLLADLYGRYLEQPALVAAFGGDVGHYNLQQLKPEALRLVIEGPAAIARLRFEPNDHGGTLADRIQLDMAAATGALPLLSFALSLLYDKAREAGGNLLTAKAYEEIGTLQGAIGLHAERTFKALPAQAQQQLPRLLRALVHAVGDDKTPTAGPVDLADWPAGTPGRQLIDALVKERLLVDDRDGAAPGARAQVRVAHKALLVHWKDAKSLLDQRPGDLVLRQRLRERADAWLETQRDAARLLTSRKELAEAKDLTERWREEFADSQYRPLREFIDASLATAEAREGERQRQEEAAREEQKRALTEKLERARKGRKRAVGLALLFALVAGIAGWQWQSAKQNEALARQSTAIADKKTADATRLATEKDAALRQEVEQRERADLEAKRASDAEKQAEGSAAEARSETRKTKEALAAALLNATEASAFSYRSFDEALSAGSLRLALAAHRLRPNETTFLALQALAEEPSMGRLERIFETHEPSWTHLAMSADGKRLASGGDAKVLRIWDLDTGQQVGASLVGHEKFINAVAFTPNQQIIVSASGDETIRLWSASDGLLRQTLRGHKGAVLSIAISRDGKLLASGGSDGTIRIWSIDTAQQTGQIDLKSTTDLAFSLDFSPDARLVLVGLVGRVEIWDRNTRKIVDRFASEDGMQYRTVRFMPDAKRAVFAHAVWSVGVWSYRSGEINRSGVKDGDSNAEAVRWLRDRPGSLPLGQLFVEDSGAIVAPGIDGSVVVWSDIDRTLREAKPAAPGLFESWKVGLPPRYVGKHRIGATTVAVASGKQFVRIASAGLDGEVRVWTYSDDTRHRLAVHAGTWKEGDPRRPAWSLSGRGIAFSPDAKRLAYGHGDRVILLDTTNSDTFSMPFKVKASLASRDTEPQTDSLMEFFKRFFPKDSASQDSSTPTPDLPQLPTIHLEPTDFSQVDGSVPTSDLSFSPTDPYVARVRGSKLDIWHSESGKPLHPPIEAHEGGAVCVAFSPDGKFVVTGGQDGNLRVWDVATGRSAAPLLAGHKGAVTGVAYSPDGARIVSAGVDGTLRFWAARTGAADGPPLQGSGWGSVWDVAWHPSGDVVATGGDDGEVVLWNVARRKELFAYRRHPASVYSVAFSRDGRFLASAGSDSRVVLADAYSGEVRSKALAVGSPVSRVVFSPDGRFIATSTGSNGMLWDAPDAWAGYLCAKLTRNFSLKEWKSIFRDAVPYKEQCPGLPVPAS